MEIQQLEGKKVIKKKIPVTVVGVGKKSSKKWLLNESVFISEGILKEVEAFTKTPRGIMNNPQNSRDDKVTMCSLMLTYTPMMPAKWKRSLKGFKSWATARIPRKTN
ncbi:hypothetical protein [Fictibacillus sp. NRS-1165]|uniref:hypothetical protein n=1 Tax=Fictibacillus sp. NRS-1165 TaxID=3144463 RepID=UPI003D1DC877